MNRLTATYSEEELAWVTPVMELRRDIYLMITLKRPGKIVIRQNNGNDKWPRAPIGRHRDMKEFRLRISVIPESMKIRVFTSTEPKEIEYAYI